MCVGFFIRLIPEPYPFGAAAYSVQICSRQICRSPQSLTEVSDWGLLRDILSLTEGQPLAGQIFSAQPNAAHLAERLDVEQVPDRVDVAYTLEVNEWNREKRLQLNVQDLQMCTSTDNPCANEGQQHA